MKRAYAGVITVALMGLLAWSSLRRSDLPSNGSEGNAQQADTAESRVNALLESASAGDVSRYLASFGSPMRERLEREVAERGRDAFADDLRRAARARKSHAVFAAEDEGPDAARVDVETVYPDRNERQAYRLERRSGAWLVADVETSRGHEPRARFGTEANYKEPEGVPVQAAAIVEDTGEDPNP